MNTFIFGIDGASPELVKKWINQNELPNLKKIKSSGVSGKLKSTFPPLTGPAWTTFQTGVNPGKHGVFNWLDLSESYRGRVISSNSIKTKTVWEIASKHGDEVGLLSLPVTFPPRPLNGLVVSGFLTPDGSQDRTYPAELAQDLEKEVPGFEYYLEEYLGGSKKEWINYLKEAVRNRGKASRFLIKRLKAQSKSSKNLLFMVHFFATDLVQHFLWDSSIEGWDPRLEIFKSVDREIGKIIEITGENTTSVLVSDHGFGSVDQIFNVNNWLRKEGYLNLKNGLSTKSKKISAKLGFNQKTLAPLGEKIYPLLKKTGALNGNLIRALTHPALKTFFLSEKDIDWQRSVAYSKSDVGHISLNLKGREKKGIVEDTEVRDLTSEIVEKLKDLKLPGTSKKLFSWVKPKQQVYSGPSIKDAPDVLFNPLQQKVIGMGANMFVSNKVFNSSFRPGNHRRNGILMASGPKTTTQKEVYYNLEDIAPTLLNLHSCPIPEQIDGKVIREISPEEPSYYRPGDFYKRRKRAGETDDSRKKLENLGYL